MAAAAASSGMVAIGAVSSRRIAVGEYARDRFAVQSARALSPEASLGGAVTEDHAQSAIRKASRRLIPFLVLCYAVNFLDRVNVGFAGLVMNDDLGFTPEVFGFGAGIFFAGYILFEIPSNLALSRFGARIWIARIMISWGLVATAVGFVAGERGPVSSVLLGLHGVAGLAG